MNTVLALTRAEFAVFFRDKAAAVFTFLFPILFIIIFGFLLGDVDEADPAAVGVLLSEESAAVVAAGEALGLRVLEFETSPSWSEAVIEQRVDFGAALEGGELRFIFNAGRAQENFAFEATARSLSSSIALAEQGGVSLIVAGRRTAGIAEQASWMRQTLPGILAFTVLSAGLFAVSGHLTAMKERKLLDRMVVTPMRPTSLLLAIVVVRLAVILLSTLLTISIARLLFGVAFDIDWARYLLFVGASTLGTMALGTVIAMVVRRASSAAQVANILAILMMFLAGIYFPSEILPGALRTVSRLLPLTYMAEAMRYVMGVSGLPQWQFWAISSGFLGVGLIMLPVLARYVVRAERG
ncbi:ABC transporter permease [Candidatus Bipolaricaulota bacterium]|nr:ABC transporter permease [Candidatus Bipolaricaulota bacterium]